MEDADEPDKLHIQENEVYESILNTNDEPVMFSDKSLKINMHGSSAERDLILTTKHIYNLSGTKVRRKISITDVKAIIKSSYNNHFVVHIPKDYDYRYSTNSRDEFIQILQLRFANLNQVDTLKIYIIDDEIEK